MFVSTAATAITAPRASAVDTARRIHTRVVAVVTSHVQPSWFDNCDTDSPYGPTPYKLAANLIGCSHLEIDAEKLAGTIDASSTATIEPFTLTKKTEPCMRRVTLRICVGSEVVVASFGIERVGLGDDAKLVSSLAFEQCV